MKITEKYEKNKNVVINIVKKHFAYSTEAIEKFIKIYDNRYDSLDPIYKELLKGGEDLKKVVKIEENTYEKIDKGFIYFYFLFPAFCKEYNIAYNNFRDWKILINKNFIKMRKTLIMFYTNPENAKFTYIDIYRYDYNSFVSYMEKGNSYFNSIKEDISKRIDNNIESVGTKKLPNRDLYAVISFDFADWFLCSTAENWSSCLNLESDYNGCFWHGLPATIGDRNRAMLYLTDFDKKNYHGIITDKILSRNWGILGTNDLINTIKSYPTPILDAESLNIIFDNKFKRVDKEVIKSKYPIGDFKTRGGNADFIFIDEGKIKKDCGHLEVSTHISGSHYVKNSSQQWVSGSNFDYNGGLRNLIEKNKNIIQVGGDKTINSCYECDEKISGSSHVHMYNNVYYCNSCKEKLFKKCEICEGWHPEEKMLFFSNKRMCKTCFDKKYFTCETCKEVLSNDLKKHTLERHGSLIHICNKCSYIYIAKCSSCEKISLEEDCIEHESKMLCKSCAIESGIIKKCYGCGIEHEVSKMTHYDGDSDDELYCKNCVRVFADVKQNFLNLFE